MDLTMYIRSAIWNLGLSISKRKAKKFGPIGKMPRLTISICFLVMREIFSLSENWLRMSTTKKKGGVAALADAVNNSAHNKLMDYILKYVGMLITEEHGAVCESGSSLFGWIEEAQACDLVYNGGKNIEKIKGFHYVGSDLSQLMNEGAKAFHQDFRMDFSEAPTIAELFDDIRERIAPRLSLFYGLSVSIRYAVRTSYDLVEAAKYSDLCVYNRLSLSLVGDKKLVYGTGKTVYVISLDDLIQGLQELGASAIFCTANMQYDRDGKDTVRASLIISENKGKLDKFIAAYRNCIEKSMNIVGVEQGEWHELINLRKYLGKL